MNDTFRKMTKDDLKLVLSWRNNPAVRNNMYNNQEISWDEHQSWFKSISKDSTKEYFVFENNDGPQGVVGFTEINSKHKKASWFFYSGNLGKRGLGSKMETWALSYAFNELKLNKLCCEVLSFNMPVVRFHQKFGFKVEGIFKQHYLRDGEFSDIYSLAIDKKTYNLTFSKSKNFKVGSTHTYNFKINQNEIIEFAKITGDNNPIHLNQEEAKKYGFKSNIIHGFLVSSAFSKVLGTDFPGKGTVYLKQDMSFLNPAYITDSFCAEFKIMSLVGRKALISTKIVSKNKPIVLGQAEVLISKELI